MVRYQQLILMKLESVCTVNTNERSLGIERQEGGYQVVSWWLWLHLDAEKEGQQLKRITAGNTRMITIYTSSHNIPSTTSSPSSAAGLLLLYKITSTSPQIVSPSWLGLIKNGRRGLGWELESLFLACYWTLLFAVLLLLPCHWMCLRGGNVYRALNSITIKRIRGSTSTQL